MRYRHLRRTTIAGLATIALCLLVIVAASHFLNRKQTRSAVARWLTSRVGSLTGADITVGELDWGLLPPRIVLHDLTIEAPAVSCRAELVAVELAGVRLVRRTIELGSVTIEGVHLKARPPSGAARGGTSWIKLAVRHLDMRRVNLEGTDLPGDLAVSLDGLSAAWTDAAGPPRGLVRVARATVAAPGLEAVTAAVEARFSFTDHFRIDHWRASRPGLQLDGDGDVEEGRVRLSGAGSLSLSELDRIVHIGGVLSGNCNVTLDLDTAAPSLLTAHVSSHSIVAAGLPLHDIAGTLSVARDGIRGTLETARFCGGRFSGRYHLLELAEPFRHRVELTGHGMDMPAFLRLLKVPDAGLAATADLDASLSWNGMAISAGEGAGVARLHPARGRLPVDGELHVALTPEGLLRFSGKELRIGSSTVSWEGPLTLATWQPAWSVRASPAALAELAPAVNAWIGATVLPADLGGTGELQLGLAGPWDHLRVEARLEAHPLTLTPIHFDRVLLAATISAGGLDITDAVYRIGDGDGGVTGSLRWAPENADNQLDLTFRGHSIPLAEVAGWLGVEKGLAGTASFTGTLRGPIARPRGSWALGLTGLEIGGLPLGDGSATVDLSDGTFQLRGLECAAGLTGNAEWRVLERVVSGHLHWDGIPTAGLGPMVERLAGSSLAGDASFQLPFDGVLTASGELRSDLLSARLSVDGSKVDVDAEMTQTARLEAHLTRGPEGAYSGAGELSLTSVGGLLVLLAPSSGIPLKGGAHAHFDVAWPAAGTPRVDGAIDRLDMKLDTQPLRLVEPASFELSESGFRMHGLWTRLGKEQEVFARWNVGADGALSGNLSGSLDALLLRILLPEWEPAGHVKGVIELTGTVEQPQLNGIAELGDGSFRIPDSQMVVSNIRGTMLLSEDRVELDGVAFRLLGGSGLVAGVVQRTGTELELDLSGSVQGAALPLFPGLTPRLSGTWFLRGPPEELVLGGDLRVDRALLQRNDDLGSILLAWFGGSGEARTSQLPQLDLHVVADHTIEARSPFVRVTGSASLHITGTPASPGLVGRIEFFEGGQFTFQGVQYEIDRAVITFANPTSIEPRIELQARAWVDTYQVTVTLTGSGDRIIPTFTSDPPLPEDQIMSLVALGSRSPGGDETLGVGLASTLLTRELNAVLEQRARGLLALDQLRVDPFADSTTGSPAARVTVVKQLSPGWTVILQSNLSTNREEVIRSRWQLAPQVFLEATRDVDGSWALDLKLRRRY